MNNSYGDMNSNGGDYTSWSFRKEPGFFDIVTYTGNGSNRTIPHSLGCVPGMIMVKRLDASDNWIVYHRGNGNSTLDASHYNIRLDSTNARQDSASRWNDTLPTASVFSVGTDGGVNDNGGSYVAYLFAGGESTAATARSVNYTSSANDLLVVGSTSDLSFGTGDFTVEGWFREDTLTNMGIFQIMGSSDGYQSSGYENTIALGHNSSGWNPYGNGISGSIPTENANLNYATGVWIHFAYTRASGTNRIFINGELLCDWSSSYDYTHTYLGIGTQYSINNRIDGQISNFRVVKGTAVYTSAFRPPTEPLTNITNTVLLCCNNSSITGSTVGTVTTGGGGGIDAWIDSPFDDPAGFVFGEDEDEGIIKCGGYVGNGSSSGPDIHLGWEPQWILLKNTFLSTQNWILVDAMRGIISNQGEEQLYPNLDSAQSVGGVCDVNPNGFQIKVSADYLNGDTQNYVYIAIRRPDGYVGKPVEAGTDVFVPTLGNSSATIPSLPSTFPADVCLYKDLGQANWGFTTRLTGPAYMATNTEGGEASTNEHQFDSMVGCHAGTWLTTNDIGYLWKRHAGLDVVTYLGNGQSVHDVAHSMNKVPEMIWVKDRDTYIDWNVYHKGLNGGTNPEEKYLVLNTNTFEADNINRWNDTAPTSTHFTVGDSGRVNTANKNYIAMLFASVAGVSALGNYSGSGSTGNAQNIGFQPRFIMIKRTNQSEDWFVFDSTNGFGKYMQLNTNAQQNTQTYVNVSSTGFSLVSDYASTNESGSNYIYYAHA